MGKNGKNSLITFLNKTLKAKKMSQRELAAEAGMSIAHISMILSGDRGVSTIRTAEKLAKATGTSRDEIIKMASTG